MTNRNFNTNTENKDEWLTPPEIIKALGDFDLDPCSPINRPWDTAKQHFTREDDGFKKEWKGRVWCNPPYGKETFKWLEKAAKHGNAMTLIFARTETKGFHEFIWEKAHSIFFFKGRISFYTVEGVKGNTANAPSCLVSYGENNTEAVKKAINENKIKGKLVIL